MKGSGGLAVVTLLLLVFALVEVRPTNAQVQRRTLTYTDGSRYEGEMRDGKRHGRGTYTWPDGTRYEGDWHEGRKHGRGTYTWADGTRHVGELRNDKFHGRGTRTWPNGNRHEGDWHEDRRHGHGTFTWADGARHVGESRNNNFHGRGTRTWANGNRYEGDWRDNKMHGRGTYTWANGTRHVGELRNGNFHGRGIRTWANGNRYEGDWRDNKMHDQGTFTWANSNRYVGDWRDNKMHGQGIFTWANGNRYEGDWRDDKMHGRGAYTWADGRLQVGEWRDGKRVQGQQQERQRQVQQRSQARAQRDVATGQDLYGSMAFSQETGGGYAWGMSWDYANLASARSSALAECRGRGGNSCAEILWFRSACGALFIGDGNGWGTGWGTNKTEAESIAREYCEAYNSNCRLEVSRCVKRPQERQRPAVEAREQTTDYWSDLERRRLQAQHIETQMPPAAEARQQANEERRQATVSATTSAPALFGSIAFSQEIDDKYTWAIVWNAASSEKARRESLSLCEQEGGMNCQEEGRFQNKCGALAVGGVNGYGTGWGDSLKEAEAMAIRNCEEWNPACRVEISRCMDSSESTKGAGQRLQWPCNKVKDVFEDDTRIDLDNPNQQHWRYMIGHALTGYYGAILFDTEVLKNCYDERLLPKEGCESRETVLSEREWSRAILQGMKNCYPALWGNPVAWRRWQSEHGLPVTGIPHSIP